jgi:hypothetical protein
MPPRNRPFSLTRERVASAADEHVRYYDRATEHDGGILVGSVVKPRDTATYAATLASGRCLGDWFADRDKAERALERAYLKKKFAPLGALATRVRSRIRRIMDNEG